MTPSRPVSRRTALKVGAGTAALPLLAGLLGTMSPAFSQQSPPDPEKAKQIAALIDSKGKSVFPEFRKTDSEWRSGDTYLFVTDMNGMALLNAAFPKMEGTDTSGLKDSNGKLIVVEVLKVVRSKGSGWVDYMFPKPGQSQPSQKWSYAKAVKIDGTPGFVGAASIHSGPDLTSASVQSRCTLQRWRGLCVWRCFRQHGRGYYMSISRSAATARGRRFRSVPIIEGRAPSGRLRLAAFPVGITISSGVIIAQDDESATCKLSSRTFPCYDRL